MRTWVVAATALAGIAAIGACEASAPWPPPAGPPDTRSERVERVVAVQLIVLFRTGTRAADPAFLAALSRDIGTPLAYVRPLSGGAHLLRASAPPESVNDLVRRLQERPEVIDVQPDVAVRRQ
jgi:hypothetical protein